VPLTAFGLPMWVCLGYLFVLGTVVGSFLNVCIYRIPTKERFWESLYAVIYPKSRCPRCRNAIPPWANVPILGWLLLRGRCFHCKGRISPRYPMIEFLNGALWALVYWMEVPAGFGASMIDSAANGPFGPVGDPSSWWLSPVALIHWRYFYHMVLIEALLVASFIDLDLWIIPDGCTLPAMAVGLVGGTALGHVYLTPVWHQNMRFANELRFWLDRSSSGLSEWIFIEGSLPQWISQTPHLHGLAVSLGGFLIAGGVVWLVRIIGHWALGREAMGFGDVVLMAMVGSFLGWQAGVIIFFMAPMFALLVVGLTFIFCRQRELPFGPYLSLATLVVILFWKQIWTSVEPIFGSGPLLILSALIMTVAFAIVMRLIRLVFEFLGISADDNDDTTGDWNSGDHLFYYGSESVDPHLGRWRNHNWPGTDSSHGWSQYDTWRNGPPGPGNGRW
jgi:leader peptidase (prepilin peptidase)/N-methyltransferase